MKVPCEPPLLDKKLYMSKLSKLRGGNSAPVAIFSSNVESNVASVFERMQSNKPSAAKAFPQKKAYVPSRFKVGQITQAEQTQGITMKTKRLVVLDEKFSFGMREHSLQGADGKWVTERCVSEWESCPLCSKENVSVYDVVFLTVLDLTPWTKTNTDGTKTEYQYTKRVLAVKKNDLPAFSGLLNVHGSLRGLVLDMTRGAGPKESASGKPTYVTTLSDDDLIEEFGSEEVLSEKGTVIRPVNDAVFPFNYEKYFPVTSRSQLNNKYDIAPRPGSAEETAPWDDPAEDTVFTLDLSELPEVD